MDVSAAPNVHLNAPSQGTETVRQVEKEIAPWRRRGFAILRILLGAVLLGATILKVFSPSDAVSFGGYLEWLSDPVWRLTVAEVEVLLGLWLLAGLFKRALWWAALVWFCGLAGASLYLGLTGQATCGCFGEKLPLSPWYAFGLDVAAVAALFLFRPSEVLRICWADLRRLLLTTAGAGAILAVSAAAVTCGMRGSDFFKSAAKAVR